MKRKLYHRNRTQNVLVCGKISDLGLMGNFFDDHFQFFKISNVCALKKKSHFISNVKVFDLIIHPKFTIFKNHSLK
jgi:hypothetical protein